MNPLILTVWSIAFGLRAVSVAISARNERRLRAAGAVEHGQRNSTVMALLHGVFYAACLAEAYVRKPAVDALTYVGIAILIGAMVCLFHVIRTLGPIWTVKVFIAETHPLNRSPLFRWAKHPNYYLNIVPELIGLSLVCGAWLSVVTILPLYLISLIVRIRQEEKAMQARFTDY